MRLPNKNLAGFAAELIKQASASLQERLNRGAMYRYLYLTGDQQGEAAIYNKTFAHIDSLSSYIYSPVNLRYDIEFYGSPSPTDRAKARCATSELHKYIRRGNVDMMMEDAVTWGLVKGKSFVKLLWGDDGFDPYLVQPEMMGVLREDIADLDKQEAFFHSTYYTPDRFQELLGERDDADEIMRKVKKYMTPSDGSSRPDKNNNLKQIVLGGMYPYTSAGSNSNSQSKGVVNWLGGPQPYLDATVLQSLIRLDELWVWDDGRDDYTTIQVVGDDVLVTGKDRHINIFADAFDPDNSEKKKKSNPGNPLSGHHPFIEICPNPLDGYFWGRSEMCNIALIQESINKRVNGINKLLRIQEDPPRAFIGASAITQQAYSKLKKPGGYLVETNPNAKIEKLSPDLPQGLFETLHEYEQMFNEMGGFSPTMQGRGESGVRAQGHAETLVRTGSPRFKDRAILVERQVENLGGLALDILKAKTGYELTAWVMPQDQSIESAVPQENDLVQPPAKGMKPVKFLLGQLPSDCKVVVDSHSSSPAFAHETRALMFDLFKAGALSPEQLVTHTNPPGEDTIIEDLQRKAIEQAEFAAKNPEEFAKMQSKKKK